MEPLQARIYLHHEKGARIAYLYGREQFNLLNAKKEDYDGASFLKAGQQISFEGKNYEIISVNFRMETGLNHMSHGVGYSVSGKEEASDYNCTINVSVTDI